MYDPSLKDEDDDDDATFRHESCCCLSVVIVPGVIDDEDENMAFCFFGFREGVKGDCVDARFLRVFLECTL